MLFHAADLRQRQLQSLVEAGQMVLEPQGVGLDTVHQDHAHPGEGIIIKLADGTAGHLFPGELLLLQRSEEHTSELQSRENLVCRLLLDKKKLLHYYPGG